MSTIIELAHPAALDRTAFEAALLDAIAAYDVEDSRFYRLVESGRSPPSLMLRYAQATHRSAELFCATLSMMVDQAPDEAARLVLLENLMEEEGVELRVGRGLVVRAERRHPDLAMRFVCACGGEAKGDSANPIADGFEMLAERRWAEAVAFLLIGQELKFAQASQALFQLLRRRGFTDHDVAFFAVHGVADLEHGRQAINLLLDRVHTRDEQELCIAAAAAGARHWFEMHGGSAKGLPAG